MLGGSSTSISTTEYGSESRFALGKPIRPFSYPPNVSK